MADHLITSALPYINGVKHLGNLVGSMLPADVYARYLRARGDNVLFVCATDEHGTPAEIAADEAGLTVAEYCSEQHEIQARVYRQFNLSFDHFGRSSSPENRRLTQHFAERLEANGLIEDRVTVQVYSPADGRFLPDRYVVGTCPKCGNTNARGDQCEMCTSLLEPTSLIEPRSAISGSRELELRETRHLFLQLEKLQTELADWLESKTDWPVLATSIARKWLDEGLRERSITRDLDWGVPVERPGYENKVYYVWFDAPIEYIGATDEWAAADPEHRRSERWWHGGADVTYTQFMAKDNVPFHTIMWPGMVMGTRESWKLVDYLKAFNWLTYYGGKFSTSSQRGVFMDDALELLPADFWRYYLIANAPESDDVDFTWEGFAATVNKDLAGTYGNLVNRTLRMTEKGFGTVVPEGGLWGEPEAELARDLRHRAAVYNDHLQNLQFRKAAAELYLIWTRGNVYLQRREPWKLVDVDRDAAAVVLRTALNLIRVVSILAAPIIPGAVETVLDTLGVPAGQRGWITADTAMDVELQVLLPGDRFVIPPPLFPRLAAEQVAAWKERFAGSAEQGDATARSAVHPG